MIITFSGARRGVNLSWVLRKDRAEREGVKKCVVDKATPPHFPPEGISEDFGCQAVSCPLESLRADSLVKLCGFGGMCPASEMQPLPGTGIVHRITESQNGSGWKGPLWVI